MAEPVARTERKGVGGTVDRALDSRANSGAKLSVNSIIEAAENAIYVAVKNQYHHDKI